MSLLNEGNLQKEVDKISKNHFEILPFKIDENTWRPILNYKDLFTNQQWSVKIPNIIDADKFLSNYFREKVEENRDKRLKDILD
jgi:hypothetical protein